MKSFTEIESIAKSCLSGKRGISYGLIFLNYVIAFAIGLIPFVGNIISFIVTGALSLGVCYFFLKILRSGEVEIDDLFVAFKSKDLFLSSLVAYLLSLAIIIPTLLIFGLIWVALFLGDIENLAQLISPSAYGDGTSAAPYTMDPSFLNPYSSPIFESGIVTIILSAIIFILIPLTIISLILSQVFFILADKKTNSGQESIKISFNIMKGNIFKLFLLQLYVFRYPILTLFVCLLLVLPNVELMTTYFVLFGILIQFFFYMPTYFTSLAKFYQELND